MVKLSVGAIRGFYWCQSQSQHLYTYHVFDEFGEKLQFAWSVYVTMEQKKCFFYLMVDLP